MDIWELIFENGYLQADISKMDIWEKIFVNGYL